MRRQSRRANRRQTRFEQFEERLALTAQAITDIQVEQQIQAPSLDLFQEVAPMLNDAHDQTGLTTVRNDYGLIGTGQTVAVIDTGIAWDHVNLGGGLGSSYRVVGGYDFAEGDSDPYDDPSGYHGTHVAGIIGSDHGTYTGVAPGVDLVGLRVFDDAGNGVFSWVEDALQWVHDHRNDYDNPITAVNLSLGATWNADTVPGWAMLEDEFAQLEADGIFIAVAAGNSFTDYNTPGLSYPAASPYVVPVASVDSSGNMSGFSQRNSRVLAAPGENIASTVPDHLFGADGNPNDLASASGTSMASPYVAGASVLLREAMEFVGQTNITQDDIYDVLYDTADLVYDSITSANYHSINLAAAFDSIMPTDDYGSTVGTAQSLGTITDVAQTTGTIGSLSDEDFFTFTAGASGTMSMTIDQTHYLDSTVELVGGGGSIVDGAFTFDVVSGQSYSFSMETAEGIGHYTLDYDLQSDAIDLGTVAQQVVTNQSVNNTFYQVTTQQAGIFTVEALFEDANGDVNLTAYTLGEVELGSSSTTGDSERIDLTLDAGTTFAIEVSGQNSNVTLRLTNLVQQLADGFTITGTSGVDTISVDLNGFDLMVNDVTYGADNASEFAVLTVNGGSGSDVLNVNGSSAAETATFSTTAFTVTSSGFSMSTTGFTNISMMGGSGDAAVMYDTTGDEQLMAASSYTQMDGSGFRFTANSFASVAAYASSGNDIATFYDSAGSDRFYSTDTYGLMRGPSDNFYNYAEGFDANYAYSQNGGTDYAYFYDSSGSDRFYSTETYGLMRGPSDNFYNYAEGFDRNYAFSQNGGTDYAYFYDSSGNDRFYSTETYGLMRGPSDNFYNYAEGFDRNYAYSQNGGTDYAYFYDSNGDDRFYSTNTYGLMRGPSDNFYNYAEGFNRNYAYSQSGGFDMAYFYDSSGDDRFYATDNYGLMRGPSDNFYNYAEGFDRNYAFSQNGGFDMAYFYDSTADDLFYATGTYGLLRDVDTTFYNYAESFDRLYASSTNGGVDNAYFYDTEGNDRFYGTDMYSLFVGENSDFYHYAQGFSSVQAISENGGDDEAFIYDVGSDETVSGAGDSFYLSDESSSTTLTGFYRVVAENKEGETAASEVDAVDYIFEEIGDWE
jgi:subtilisin family serine protease